jgi:hypothetical protein
MARDVGVSRHKADMRPWGQVPPEFTLTWAGQPWSTPEKAAAVGRETGKRLKNLTNSPRRTCRLPGDGARPGSLLGKAPPRRGRIMNVAGVRARDQERTFYRSARSIVPLTRDSFKALATCTPCASRLAPLPRSRWSGPLRSEGTGSEGAPGLHGAKRWLQVSLASQTTRSPVTLPSVDRTKFFSNLRTASW